MKPWLRLLYYLMINVLVSACTTLAVLMIWDRDRTQTPAAPPAEPTTSAFSALVTSTAVQALQTPGQTAAVTPSPTMVVVNIEDVSEYQVEDGDTLGLIAERFDVSVEELMSINQLKDPNSLPVGMILYVPLPPEKRPTKTSPPTSTSAPLGTPAPTNPPQEARLIINAVIGPGDLASEHVFITRTGDGELSLAGWQLKDDDGNVFVFPQLQMYKDGAVNVWTTTGVNTVVDLYWGLGSAVWSSGEKVTLLDAEGNVKATYTVP
jgi:LysM repeat protein